jgi:putative transposase
MRKPRSLKNNAKYFVTAKVHRNEHIFNPDEFKDLFINTMKRAKKKYNFLLENFVIMDNYISFLIKPVENESLSKIMQWILSVYAMKYNKTHNYNGQVFRDRFYSKIIDNIEQFEKLFNDILNEPVKEKIVINPEEYKYGGLYYILKKIFDIIEKPKYDFFIKKWA